MAKEFWNDMGGTVFPDTNLEAVIREEIRKPVGDIRRSDLYGITTLTTDDEHIQDITGINQCINLTELSFRNNQVSDISPLAGLTNLTDLSIANNQVSNISPLAGLTSFTASSRNSFVYLPCGIPFILTPPSFYST